MIYYDKANIKELAANIEGTFLYYSFWQSVNDIDLDFKSSHL